MTPLLVARRLLLIVVLLSTGLATSGPSAVAAAQSCDPAYPDFCIPSFEDVGDLNCADVGYANFTVLDPDPHQFGQHFLGLGHVGPGDPGG